MTLNSKQLVLIAVRLKSSRLKKKALAELSGRPLILCLFQRLNERIPSENIVLCTSKHSQDDELCTLAKNNSIQFFRGSELDVAQRFIDAANEYGAETIVRVTGDNPLTDPEIILSMLKSHNENKSEYTYVSSLPIGTSAEVIDVAALKRSKREWTDPNSSEYMTYMLQRADKIKQNEFTVECQALNRPELRLTVDTPKDYHCMNLIYEHFIGFLPGLIEIIEFLDSSPKIKQVESRENLVSLPDHIDCSYIGDKL